MISLIGRLAASIVLALFLVAPGIGEESADAGDTSRIEALKEALEGDGSAPEPTRAVAPDVVPLELLGEDGADAMRAAFKSYYDYRVHGFEHRKNVFAWQLLSSKIIFAMVVAIVFLGIYFSWLQFHASRRPGSEGEGASTDTTVELGTTGIKVTSPVLGVIILTLSLAFFYLYLVNVYPIGEIF